MFKWITALAALSLLFSAAPQTAYAEGYSVNAGGTVSIQEPDASDAPRVQFTGSIEICVRPFYVDSGIVDKQYDLNCNWVRKFHEGTEMGFFSRPLVDDKVIEDSEISGYKAEARRVVPYKVSDNPHRLYSYNYTQFKNGATVMYGLVKSIRKVVWPRTGYQIGMVEALFAQIACGPLCGLWAAPAPGQKQIDDELVITFDGRHFDTD